MSMESREKIRNCIRQILSRREKNPQFGDSEPLLSAGRLHSVEVLEIAVFLEREFGVDLSARPFDQYAFDTVDGIAAQIGQ